MIAIAIVGIIAAMAIPYFIVHREIARFAVAVADLRVIAKALESELITSGVLPDSLADLSMDQMRDPWGNPYQYLRIQGSEKKNLQGEVRKDRFMVPVNTDFDLYSMGPDGRSKAPFTAQASRDDAVRANNGGYYGKASLF